MRRFVHTERLARDLGQDTLDLLAFQSTGMRWPVPVAGTPYHAYDGHFCHEIGGHGFSSLSDIIQEATINSKRQDLWFEKAGTATSANPVSYWNVGRRPAAGGTVTAIPGGAVPTNTTVGGLAQSNPASGDTLHITGATFLTTISAEVNLLYDRIWHGGSVDHTIATSQSVTGVPTRYTGTSAGGNFVFLEVTTGLGATAQNVTVTYVDENGNAAESAPAIAVTASAAATRLPHTRYYIPLATGDYGIRNVTAVEFSAANTGGASAVVIGHPLCFFPTRQLNKFFQVDFTNTVFALPQVRSNACLAWIAATKNSSGADQMYGHITLVSG